MAEPFKELFNQKFVTDLESAIHKVHPSFNTGEFQNSVLDENWADRELKQRMRHISESLRPYLPSDYVQAIDILKNASEGFSGLAHIVFADFVEVFGLDHFDASVNALELFVAFLQAYVFTLLTAVFIGAAIEEHHHAEEHH